MNLLPILGLAAYVLFLFKENGETNGDDTDTDTDTDTGTGASFGIVQERFSDPVPRAGQTLVNGDVVPHHSGDQHAGQSTVYTNPRSGRCFSKVDRAGFSDDRVPSTR